MNGNAVHGGVTTALAVDGNPGTFRGDIDMYLRPLAVVLGFCPHFLRGMQKPERVRAALSFQALRDLDT